MANTRRQHLSIQGIQEQWPWIMRPVEWLEVLVSPRRWLCAFGHTGARHSTLVDSTRLALHLTQLMSVLEPPCERLLARSAGLARLDWHTRKFVWSLLWALTVVYRLRPKHVGQPQREKPINLISAPQSYPDFQAQRLLVPDDVSCAEASLLGDLTVQFLHFMQDVYPIMTCHQPVAATDPQQRLREAYSFLYRAVRPPPTWHPELTQAAQAQNLLGALAVGGPFAKLLICEDRETQTFTIDLRHMQAYPVREGLCRLGCKINFVAQDGRLTVANIVYNDETVSPGDKTWGITERIALCSLVTHLTVWRHGMQYHVAGLAPVAVVTHNLPPAHPIRRLLAVHIAETLSTNYYTHLTLRRSGFDVTGFSFPRDVIFRYYDDGAKAFALTSLDVRLDIAQRGMRETLWYPYASQALRYYDLFASYVSAYVQHYYPDDRALQADVDACAWFDMLDRSFVNSIRSYVPSLTKDNLIKFCTLFIYSVTVEHEQNTLWDYAVFLPTTVRQDGIGQSVGEVQSVLNFQFVISSATNRLMHDFSALALDAGAAQIMRHLQAELRALQDAMDHEPDHYWCVYPQDLEASVSA